MDNDNIEEEQSMFANINIPNNKIKHYTQNINASVHHFYLYGEVQDNIDSYADLLNILKTSSANDVIYIYINSEGGSMRMTLQIVNSMVSSQADIITCLDGEAMSAASMIFLAGHSYIVNPNCTFMIHNYTGGMRGKGHELTSQLEHINKNVKNVLENFYSKILTEDELKQVSCGRDIWMDSEELTKRLDLNENGNGKCEKCGEDEQQLDIFDDC